MATKKRLTIACGSLLIIAVVVAAEAMSSLGILTSGGQGRIPTVKWMYRTADSISYSPVVTDLDGDSKPEILVVDFDLLYCLDGAGGVKWRDFIWYIDAGVAAGDVDGDGQSEVMVARRIWGSLTTNLFCLNPTGTLQWNKTIAAWFAGTPTLADLNGDNKSEILIGSGVVANYSGGLLYPGRLFCLNGSGELEWSYASANYSLYYTSVYDLDGDDKQEVMVPVGPTICCLNASGGLKWNATVGSVGCPPVIADVDNDGKPEIILGAGGVSCLNASGAVEWTYPIVGSVRDIVVADVTGSGKSEIVATAGNQVYCLNGSSSLEWVSTMGNGNAYRLAVADVDKDGMQEVVVGTLSTYSEGSWQRGGVICCLNSTGGLKWSYPTDGEDISSVPLVTDVDGDALPEIIVAARWTHIVYCLSAFPGREGVTTLSSMPFVLAGLIIAGVAAAVVSSVRKKDVASHLGTLEEGRLSS